MSKARRQSSSQSQGGSAPSNRGPSDRKSREVRLLSAGIDSLYWSAPVGIAPDTFAALKAARDSDGPARERSRTINGFDLTLAPHGAGRYPVLFQCHEFWVQITDSQSLPTLYVQLRAPFIHEVGIAAAVKESRSVAEAVTQRRIVEPHVSRLDLYADFADWVIRRQDVAGVVTNAKIATHARAGTDELETIMAGKTPKAVRLYRKDVEVREHGGFAPLFWSGHAGPVLRVEVQASSETLRTLGISSVSEALSCHGDLWAWALSAFIEVRVPGAGDREDWPLTPEWALVQEVGISQFPRCGLVPYRVVEGKRAHVVPALLGYLQSYAAMENLSRPRDVLHRLAKQFPDLIWGAVPFHDLVARKRAMLPRSYRLAQERGEPVASGRDRPPSLEGGDSESSTVGSDA